MEMILVMLVGAVAAVLANRGIAVFNDGLRPIMPEHIEGRMDRRSLALTSLAMSFGLVLGFGIPILDRQHFIDPQHPLGHRYHWAVRPR